MPRPTSVTESATGYVILAISLASRFLVSFSLSENDKTLGRNLAITVQPQMMHVPTHLDFSLVSAGKWDSRFCSSSYEHTPERQSVHTYRT